MVLCFRNMANLLINSDLLELRERFLGFAMGIRPRVVGRRNDTVPSARLLGECVDSTTASQTVGRTLPPVRRHGDSPSVHGHKMRMHQTGATSTLEVQ